MSRFAFVTWDGGGNIPPAVGIAQELAALGHHVTFVGYESQREPFAQHGFAFRTLRRSGEFDLYAAIDPAQRLAGLIANVLACPEHLDDIRSAAEESQSDVLIVDILMRGALAALACLPVPGAVLAHSTISGLIPPPESPMGTALLTATNQLRGLVGLPALRRLNDAWLGYPTLVTTIPDLDPAAADAGAEVHYVGPIRERIADHGWDSPWARDDHRPLVVVSFTTTGVWDQSSRLRNTLEALAGEPVRVLATAPRGWTAAAVPTNAAVRHFVPHGVVLPLASVVVTHAGHGTVAAALASGVPLVALPNLAADQPFLAATVQRLGAGLALDGAAAPEAIRAAVTQILKQPSYANAAAKLRGAIQAMPGPGGAAGILEGLVSIRYAPAGRHTQC